MSASGWAGAITATCAVAALLCIMAARGRRRRDRLAWLSIAGAIALLGVQRWQGWQLSALLFLQSMARASGWYGGRHWPQVVALALIVALGLACARLVARGRWPGPVRAAGLAVAVAALFTLANIVSLHGWDRLVDTPVAGIRPWAAVELACAAVVALAAARMTRRR